jgi:hypothetical protein
LDYSFGEVLPTTVVEALGVRQADPYLKLRTKLLDSIDDRQKYSVTIGDVVAQKAVLAVPDRFTQSVDGHLDAGFCDGAANCDEHGTIEVVRYESSSSVRVQLVHTIHIDYEGLVPRLVHQVHDVCCV